jgi:hypothetical protein
MLKLFKKVKESQKQKSQPQEYNIGDAIDFIHEKTGIDTNLIFKVLSKEVDYLNKIGY